MRFTRRYPSFAVLISYLLLAVGAGPLHFWQISGCGQTCVVSTATTSNTTHAGSDLCGHKHCDSQQPHTESLHTEDSPPPRQHHDPSDCFVCRILGQAQDKALPASLDLSDEVVAAVPPALSDYFPQSFSKGFHSRAPPAA
jgi:hypothetical protein